MTREEAIKKIKEAMPTLWKETKEAIQVLVPELCENDNERIRKDIINYIGFEKPIADKDENRIKEMITYLERQKEQDKCPEYCVRSHCIGCSIYENQKEQKEKNLRDFIDNFPYNEKQKEQNPEKKHVVTRDFTSTDAIESCMLRYLQSAANRKDDIEIIEDTKKYKKQLLEIVKQKEQKTTYWNPTEEDVKLFNKAVITNTCLTPQEKAKLDIIRTKFKHRPYIVTTECIEFDNEFKNQVSHLITSVLNGEHSYSRDFVEWVSQQLLGYAKNEMKTTEWSEEDETEIKQTIGLIEGWMNTFKETYYATDCKKSISWLKSLRPQPKQEWSEEDETHRAFILESLEDQIRFCKKDAEGAYYAKQIRTAQNWLKSLPERFNFESKPAECNKVTINGKPIPTENHSVDIPLAEWSDEDEKMLKWAIRIIVEYSDIDEEGSEIVQNWLKSLRPRPHWEPSEQEKGALRTAIHVLTDERNFPKAAAHLQNILNAFEGEESRKDWKPSDEQMKALSWLVEYVAPSEEYIILIKKLYEQLKKL